MKNCLVLSLLLSLLLLGCSPKEAEIKGEVFIATEGAAIHKLGAVPINIYRKSNQEMMRMTFDNLIKEPPFKTIITDSEGKFSITLPNGEYAVAAFSTRKFFNKMEIYKWMIPVDARKGSISVSLNNQNLIPEE